MRTTHLSFWWSRIKSNFSMSMGSSRIPTSTSPFSICSFTRSALAVNRSKVTRGYFSLNAPIRSGRIQTAASSPLPMTIFPSTSSSCSVSSSSVFWTRDNISSALRLKSIPSLVRVIFLAPLSKSFTPISSSSPDSWRLKVGWVMWRTSAARLIPSSRTTVRKYLRTRISMVFASPIIFF